MKCTDSESKRRVRWTIGGDRIVVGYDVGTNTATVNALFHSIVSTHSLMANIDIVDYYLGALLPSPESVRIDVSSISIPPSKNFVSFRFSTTPTANPLSSAMSSKLSPAFPNPVSYPNFVLSISSPSMVSPKLPPHVLLPPYRQTTSPPCCLISALRGVGRHHHLPSTPRLYLIPTSLHTSHPHLSPPLLPQSPPQKKHGSNK
jgi:hypothetical protein